MSVRACRFITLLLVALSLSSVGARVLEVPQKLRYDATLSATVNRSLDGDFALVGGTLQVGAVVAACVLSFLVRERRPTFDWTMAGAIGLLLGLSCWLATVAWVNGLVSEALARSPDAVPDVWMQYRSRWEYGHAGSSLLQLGALAALLMSVLVETGPEPEPVRFRLRPSVRRRSAAPDPAATAFVRGHRHSP